MEILHFKQKSGRKIRFLMSQMDQLKIENLILYN